MVNTFLPYPSFEKSAKVLDNKRLWKQVLEANQILKALRDPNYGWQNHPATLMWTNCEGSLENYIQVFVNEWLSRRISFDLTAKISNLQRLRVRNPSWLGNEEFHSSHRAALLKKDYDHYKQFNWKEKPKIEYVWPVRRGGVVSWLIMNFFVRNI